MRRDRDHDMDGGRDGSRDGRSIKRQSSEIKRIIIVESKK